MQPVPSPASFPQQGAPQGTQHSTQPVNPGTLATHAMPRSVDAARERLTGIEKLTTLEQVDAFDAVHRLLQDSLAAVEQELRTDTPQGQGGQGQGGQGQGEGQNVPGGQRPGSQNHGQNRHGKNRHGRR